MSENILWITLEQQPASWRGIPFSITAATVTPFRNVVVHQYPYKQPSFEDMGPAPVQVAMQGYMGGSFVYLTQLALMAACSDVIGSGLLIHPNLGAMKAQLINASFAQTKEALGVVSLSFTFIIDKSETSYPSLFLNTQGIIGTISAAVGDALSTDFAAGLADGLSFVSGVIQMSRLAIGITGSIMEDAAGAMNAVRGVGLILGDTVTTGRYADGNLTAPPKALSTVDLTLPVSGIARMAVATSLAAATTARSAVQAAGADMLAAGETMTVATAPRFTKAIHTLLTTLASAIPDPSDQIRLISQLADFHSSSSLPGAAMTAAAVRRASLEALAASVAAYQPQSSTDAQDVLDAILPLFDSEIEYAADAGDDATYRAMKSLRTAVVNDLQTRGSQLPELIEITLPSSMPSAYLANWLYQDATRSDELVRRNNPIHPLFMPVLIEALAS